MIGLIGCGNMGKAILSGILQNNIEEKENIIVSRRSKKSADKIKDEYGVCVTLKNGEVAEKSELLFICVKPNLFSEISNEIKDCIKKDTIIVSIAAGLTISRLEALFGEDKKIVRVMPNTPSQVGEGMSAVTPNENAKADADKVLSIFNSFGRAKMVPEKLMDTVTAVSGSSPAYIFMLIEAMADGAVQGGMPRDLAYEFSAQAVLGSAKMVLESGLNPSALKDMVCSPGGTTIEAVASLERNGFRNSIIEAIRVCREKSESM